MSRDGSALRSMTGFGRAEGPLSARWRAEVVARSVNHRHLEVSVRLRDDLGFLEPGIRRRVGEVCRRGKVDLSIRIRAVGAASAPRVDPEALEAAWRALETAASGKGLPMPDSIAPLLGFPGVMPAGDPDQLLDEPERAAFDALLGSALAALDAERRREGEGLGGVLGTLRDRLRDRHRRLSDLRPAWLEAQSAALGQRLAALLGEAAIDPARLAQEVAVLADRTDVTEEIDRLAIHLERLDGLLAGETEGSRDAGRGRALDFLAQELAREVGTCGAKLRHPEAAGLVLELKGIVEKIREQVQNVE